MINQNRIPPDPAIRELNTNSAHDDLLRTELRDHVPRVGNHNVGVDPLLVKSLDLFRGPGVSRSVALFVRGFVQSERRQLQLNTLDVNTLRDAQRHPESLGNLVVRVWGPSGCLGDLDEARQNHIIDRHVCRAQTPFPENQPL